MLIIISQLEKLGMKKFKKSEKIKIVCLWNIMENETTNKIGRKDF